MKKLILLVVFAAVGWVVLLADQTVPAAMAAAAPNCPGGNGSSRIVCDVFDNCSSVVELWRSMR
jgi:hypothetical protein